MVVLTVAGSDSGGGAGIQADLKVCALTGVFGVSVVTAITAQSSRGVRSVYAVPSRVVAAQLRAVLSDGLPIAAAKTGMMATVSTVRAVARALANASFPLVVDPVIRATSGARLLDVAGVRALRELLLPRAALVTPNLDEATALTGCAVSSVASMRVAARRLVAVGAGAALIKGGHLRRAPRDILFDGEDVIEFPHRRVHTRHTHGTGCVLSAAVTTRLALGATLRDAVRAAVGDVAAILARSAPMGRGRGAADPLLARHRFASGN